MLEEYKTVKVERDPLYEMFRDALGNSGESVPETAKIYMGHVKDFPSARFQHSFPEDFNKHGVDWQGMWKSVGLERPPTGITADQKAEMIVRADGQKDLNLHLRRIYYKADNRVDVEWDVDRSEPSANGTSKKCPYAIVILPREAEVHHSFNSGP